MRSVCAWLARAGRAKVRLALGLSLCLAAGTAWAEPPVAADAAPPTELRAYAGGPLPGIQLPVLDGPGFDLAQGQGRVVLVHFFATWCEPCREELPALSRLAARHAGQVMVIGIDVAEVDARVRRFFDTLPVAFPIALDRDRQVTRAWSVSALPTTVVFDRTLAPRFIATGDVAWDGPQAEAVIAGLLATPPPSLSSGPSSPPPATDQRAETAQPGRPSP